MQFVDEAHKPNVERLCLPHIWFQSYKKNVQKSTKLLLLLLNVRMEIALGDRWLEGNMEELLQGYWQSVSWSGCWLMWVYYSAGDLYFIDLYFMIYVLLYIICYVSFKPRKMGIDWSQSEGIQRAFFRNFLFSSEHRPLIKKPSTTPSMSNLCHTGSRPGTATSCLDNIFISSG